MSLLNEPLFYYLVGFIAGIALCIIAITGTIRGRWGRIIVSVKSVPLRIAFFFISVALLTFLIWMVRHQIAAAIQSIVQPS
jgi:hypothetical protein